MTSAAQVWNKDAKDEFLEGLRARYEEEGFSVTIRPGPEQLPDFFGSYCPDALARKPGLNVAIEVKTRPTSATQRSLVEIRKLFEGHPDWQFNVAFMGSDPMQSVTIPAAAPSIVRARVAEVTSLAGEGHHRAAFLLAWSLLEAAMRALGGEMADRPKTAGTIVQTLAMDGYIGPDMERRLRALTDLRNRIVHGDLSAEPSSMDISLLVTAINETLTADAA